MPENKPENKNNKPDININVSYVNESDIVNGNLTAMQLNDVRTFSTQFKINEDIVTVDIPRSASNDMKNCYSLQNWRDDFKNGMSTEEIFSKIKSDVKENPQIVSQYLATIMTEFYDREAKQENTGSTALETLDMFLKTPVGKQIDGFVCMNIHEFGMRLLDEVGIESAVIQGKYQGAESHATLLFKNEDGKYTYVDYGKTFVVEASNIKDAVREICKRSADIESCGYISILNDKGSYQEYALKDEAIWGNEMDKRDYNSNTIFDHKLQDKSSVDINANISNHLSSEVTLGTTVIKDKNNVTSQYSVELGYKQNNRETALADASTSIGAKFAYDGVKKGTKLGDLKFGTKAIVSENILTFKNESHQYSVTENSVENLKITRDDIKDNLSRQGYDSLPQDVETLIGDCVDGHNEMVQTQINDLKSNEYIVKGKSYNTSILSRSYINSSGVIYNDENNQISRFNEINGMVGATANFEGELAASFDGQVGTEHGIQAKTKINNTVLNNEASIGAIGNLRYNGGNQIPSIMVGGKFNVNTGFQSRPKENVVLGGNVSIYAVPTNAYTDVGANANAYASYRPNNSKITIFGAANVGYKQQDLHLGFNEKTEKQVTFGGTMGVDINNKAKIAMSYQGLSDKINTTRNNSVISLNAKIDL